MHEGAPSSRLLTFETWGFRTGKLVGEKDKGALRRRELEPKDLEYTLREGLLTMPETPLKSYS